MKKMGLYIHIPFCIKKCNYCDFNSYANMDQIKEQYVHAVISEMQLYKNDNMLVDTIYIGGGTPTCLEPNLIEKISQAYYKIFNISEDCEISIECNPGTLSPDMLKSLKEMAINRLSIGLQSWHNEELLQLGRIHTKEQFLKNYLNARRVGFNNINIDLMFSLPFQSLEQWLGTVDQIIQLKPEHISCYSLKIEEGTPFYDAYNKGTLTLPDDDTDRQMYHEAIEQLKFNAYEHYEISNFAKKGFECKHNLRYWKCKEYIGIGAGAHSFINGERFSKVLLPLDYIQQVENHQITHMDSIWLERDDELAEYMFLGLRLIKGIGSKEFYERFGMDIRAVYGDILNKYIHMDLMTLKDGHYKLTERGIDVSNQIFMEFIG